MPFFKRRFLFCDDRESEIQVVPTGLRVSIPHGEAVINWVVALWHKDGHIVRDACIGDGPVDTVFKVISKLTGVNVTLKDYRLRNVIVGEDA